MARYLVHHLLQLSFSHRTICGDEDGSNRKTMIVEDIHVVGLAEAPKQRLEGAFLMLGERISVLADHLKKKVLIYKILLVAV